MNKARQFVKLGRALSFRERLTKTQRRKKLKPTNARISPESGHLVIGDSDDRFVQALRKPEAVRLAYFILDAYGVER